MSEFPELEGPEILPAGGKAERLVVLVHGYGANGPDLIPLGKTWSAEMPSVAFVAPNAPDLVPQSAGGRQWFGFDAAGPDEMRAALKHAAGTLEAFIDAELARFSLTNAELALVGFSQGTMLALEIGLRRTPQIAALVGYSGSLPNGETLDDEMRAKPPILLVHGDADPMIPVKALLRSVLTLKEHGLMPKWEISHDLGHGIDDEGVGHGLAFLAEHFSI